VKRSPLKRRARPRKQPDEIVRMGQFKASAFGVSCLACGDLLDGGWHAHHVVTQQHVRRAGGDVWDPRNAMRLCTPCHGAHHSRQRPIPYSAVPPDAWDFATELLGRDGAEAFFARYYQPRRVIGY
jgi:5-methylcytosine-specific restriction endonuclease McrA